ncbi:NUMOD4 motif-containing HNH endonuclease [Paraburkholderia tropica]|uniref:NUMOD4 motif-containing HNH endonuclease n=1 Tax=Paraburkholderia tropica TaxID=92647 RepID=UPI003D27B7F6
MEQWKSVVGYEGFYEVSDLGGVRSLDRPGGRGCSDAVRHGRVLKPFVDSGNGYLAVNLSKCGKARKRTVHTLVLEAFVGPRPMGMEGCHGDGDRTNARLGNLSWDTPSKNWDDKRRHGTATVGERSPSAKLTEDQVSMILVSRLSSLKLAPLLGVASSTIRAVRLGQNWKYATGLSGARKMGITEEVECSL